jgi:hypothetical protein
MSKDITHELDDLVVEYLAVTSLAEQAAQRLGEIRDLLSERLALGSHNIAGCKVSLSKRGVLDKRALADQYPQAEFPHLYQTELDTKSVRDNIANSVLKSLFTIPGLVTVQVRKPVKDN